MRVPISVTLDENLLTAIDDESRGLPRSRVIETLVIRGLEMPDPANDGGGHER